MTVPVAGWYADPSGGPGLRYWNGSGWTDSTQQGPAPQPLQYGVGGYSPYAYPPAPTGPAPGLLAQNKTSFITVGICIVYLAIAGFAHLVFFGILPVLYTVRSFQAKEPLAILAAIVTVVTIGFSIWRTTH